MNEMAAAEITAFAAGAGPPEKTMPTRRMWSPARPELILLAMGRGAYQRAAERQRLLHTGVALAFSVGASAHAVAATAQPPAADPLPTLRIRAAVAEESGTAVVDRAWLDAQVEMAGRIFAAAGVSFVLDDVRVLDEGHARIETRADRHALGAEMRDDVINWFVVRSLRDVDDPSLHRMGVHWRPAGRPGKHFVIVAANAAPDVLAHELGHFFGNPHSATPGNVMSYTRDREHAIAFFDPAQIVRIRRFARRFLRSRQLVPVAEPSGGSG